MFNALFKVVNEFLQYGQSLARLSQYRLGLGVIFQKLVSFPVIVLFSF